MGVRPDPLTEMSRQASLDAAWFLDEHGTTELEKMMGGGKRHEEALQRIEQERKDESRQRQLTIGAGAAAILAGLVFWTVAVVLGKPPQGGTRPE